MIDKMRNDKCQNTSLAHIALIETALIAHKIDADNLLVLNLT